MSSDNRVKKLRGSGGFVMANIGDDLQQKGNLGGPDLFLAPIGRLPESSISSYHCNVCERDYEGCPKIDCKYPNETVAENMVLIESGQYLCTTCDSTIAEYRLFKKPENGLDVGLAKTSSQISSLQDNVQMPPMPEELPLVPEPSRIAEAPVSISSIAGMTIYDERAFKIGVAREVGVDPSSGSLVLTIESDDGTTSSLPWSRIGKVGEIIILGSSCASTNASSASETSVCSSCNFSNKTGSRFCEDCGQQL